MVWLIGFSLLVFIREFQPYYLKMVLWYPELYVHVHVMVDVQVVHPCFSWIFLVICARVMVGGLLCPGCGLELFDVGLLVVMLGCPVMLFRGGVVRLLCSLLWWPFGFMFCPFPSIRGGVVRFSGF